MWGVGEGGEQIRRITLPPLNIKHHNGRIALTWNAFLILSKTSSSVSTKQICMLANTASKDLNTCVWCSVYGCTVYCVMRIACSMGISHACSNTSL
jgi:hypothetical protein